MTVPELKDLVMNHYKQQILYQVYKVIFNLNLIGNPVGVVGGIAGGFKDLFYEPFQGIFISPEGFIEGLGIGLHSAVKGGVGKLNA